MARVEEGSTIMQSSLGPSKDERWKAKVGTDGSSDTHFMIYFESPFISARLPETPSQKILTWLLFRVVVIYFDTLF